MKIDNILVLALATALFGCASTNHKEAKSSLNHEYKIEPTKASDLIQANTAEQYYQIGRKYQKEGKYDLAITSFQKALLLENEDSSTLQKKYTSSITGLARAYADQKLYFLAIPLFKKVVSINPTPANYNNLGYAYYLNSQYEEATQSLNKALALDSQYVQASKNLSLVSKYLDANIGDKSSSNIEKSATVLKQADLINEAVKVKYIKKQIIKVQKEKRTLNKVKNSIYTLNFEYKLNSEIPAQQLLPISTMSASNEKGNINKPIKILASGGISLKLMPAISQLFDIGNKMLALFTPTHSSKYIEVINGNGLKGIASTVVKKLKEGSSLSNYRVADAKRFNKSKTYIYYKSGFRDDAVKLNHSLLNRPNLVRNDNLPNDVMIRLVLGLDLVRKDRKT